MSRPRRLHSNLIAQERVERAPQLAACFLQHYRSISTTCFRPNFRRRRMLRKLLLLHVLDCAGIRNERPNVLRRRHINILVHQKKLTSCVYQRSRGHYPTRHSFFGSTLPPCRSVLRSALHVPNQVFWCVSTCQSPLAGLRPICEVCMYPTRTNHFQQASAGLSGSFQPKRPAEAFPSGYWLVVSGYIVLDSL